MKGISTVIATILMLMIVVALGGTTYLFVSGILTGKVSTTFEIVESVNDTLTIRNSGTGPINRMTATLDGNPATTIFDLNNNLVGYWKFNEGSGTLVKDSSGKGNDGALNGPTWVDGKFGKAIQFDEAGAISFGDKSEVDMGTSSFTIDIWLKITSISGVQYLVTKAHGISAVSGEEGWSVELTSAGAARVGISAGTGGAAFSNPTSGLNDGKWHHIAMVVDRTNSQFNKYVDGALSGSADAFTVSGSIDNGHSLYMGTIANPPYGYFCCGAMDEVSIYNKALTQNQIDALYVAGGETILEPGRTVTIKPITSASLSKGTHTLQLCTSSICNTAILTII